MTNEIRNLMFDLAAKKTIYDEETDRVVSVSEASDKIQKYCLDELGLNEKSTSRDITRALKTEKANKIFEMIEDVLDVEVATGWKDNEFFNEYVEDKNMRDGDDNEFWTDNDVILIVTKVAGDHHDLEFCRVCVAKVA